MAARSGMGGLVWEVWWAAPTGTGLFVESLLNLLGLLYKPIGVQRPRGSDLLIIKSFFARLQGCFAAVYRRAPRSQSIS